MAWLRFIRLLLLLAAGDCARGAVRRHAAARRRFLTGQLLVAAPSMSDPRFRA
jgi:hypothetical protein